MLGSGLFSAGDTSGKDGFGFRFFMADLAACACVFLFFFVRFKRLFSSMTLSVTILKYGRYVAKALSSKIAIRTILCW